MTAHRDKARKALSACSSTADAPHSALRRAVVMGTRPGKPAAPRQCVQPVTAARARLALAAHRHAGTQRGDRRRVVGQVRRVQLAQHGRAAAAAAHLHQRLGHQRLALLALAPTLPAPRARTRVYRVTTHCALPPPVLSDSPRAAALLLPTSSLAPASIGLGVG